MIARVVGLAWKKEELASASLGEFQFWTKYVGNHLVDLNDANGADILDLRFWLEGQ